MKHTPKRSKSRIVQYNFGFPPHPHVNFSEEEMEKLLEGAKKDGIVSQYDTGRGNCVWFEGYPGKEMRTVRKRVLEVIADYPAWYRRRFGVDPQP
jgi:uncharacterized protein YodC (DUF2158 family)